MFDEVLLRTYEGNVEELELELSTLQYYKGFDGEIVEKYVTCKRANCICHRGYPHGPNKYFRYREGNIWKELYLGKKIKDEYIEKVESNKRIREIQKELRVLKKKIQEIRERIYGTIDQNNTTVQMTIDIFE